MGGLIEMQASEFEIITAFVYVEAKIETHSNNVDFFSNFKRGRERYQKQSPNKGNILTLTQRNSAGFEATPRVCSARRPKQFNVFGELHSNFLQ